MDDYNNDNYVPGSGEDSGNRRNQEGNSWQYGTDPNGQPNQTDSNEQYYGNNGSNAGGYQGNRPYQSTPGVNINPDFGQGYQQDPNQAAYGYQGGEPPVYGGDPNIPQYEDLQSAGDGTTEIPYDNQPQSSFYSNNPDPDNQNGGKKKKGNTGLKVFAIIMSVVLVFTVLIFTGYVLYKEGVYKTELSESTALPQNSASLDITQTPSNGAIAKATGDEMNSEDIAAKVMPSVVGLRSYAMTAANAADAAYNEGSGIIMSTDGFIITNAHVVLMEDGATPVDKVEVHLDNDEICAATIIGVDPRTDLAVVKIEKTNLVAAEFGDSTALKVGEKAIAIGNPTGLTLSSSLTQGVISGVDRSISVGTSGYTMKCIQTDAAINPGNSGGALVNKFGQVVGINSSKIAATEYEGIGFAIPINEAKPIIDSLIEHGYVSNRVQIGIQFTSVTKAMSELKGIPTGLRVVTVDSTTDAFTKGITPGDIITKMDGQDVITLEDVSAVLSQKKPGDSVQLTVARYRGGSMEEITVDVLLREDTSSKIVVK